MKTLISLLLFTIIIFSFACKEDNPVINNNQGVDYYKYEMTVVPYSEGKYQNDSAFLVLA